MLLEQLRYDVWKYNLELPKYGLIKMTSGNISGRDKETGLVVIKPSGYGYEEMKPEDIPKVDQSREQMQVNPALADLLRVLLKAKSESLGVAPRLIASSSELDQIAAGDRDVPALNGWRREAFGDDAMRLCKGEIALSAKGNEVRVVHL